MTALIKGLPGNGTYGRYAPCGAITRPRLLHHSVGHDPSADLEAASAEGDTGPVEHMTLLISHSVPETQIRIVEQWESASWNDHVLRHQIKALMMWAVKVGSQDGVKSIGYRLPDKVYRALLGERILPVEALNAEAKNIWFPDIYVDVYPSSKEQDDVYGAKADFRSFGLDKIVRRPPEPQASAPVDRDDQEQALDRSGD